MLYNILWGFRDKSFTNPCVRCDKPVNRMLSVFATFEPESQEWWYNYGKWNGCRLIQLWSDSVLAYGPDTVGFHPKEYEDYVFKLYHNASYDQVERYMRATSRVNNVLSGKVFDFEGDSFKIVVNPILDVIQMQDHCSLAVSRFIDLPNERSRKYTLYDGGKSAGPDYEKLLNTKLDEYGITFVAMDNFSIDLESKTIYITDLLCSMNELDKLECSV